MNAIQSGFEDVLSCHAPSNVAQLAINASLRVFVASLVKRDNLESFFKQACYFAFLL